MDSTHRRHLERLARASAYATLNATDLPDTSKAGLAATGIRAILDEIDTIEAMRASNLQFLRQATGGKNDERKSLRAQLRAISETARIIGLDHPEVKGVFKFNAANKSDITLLAAARSFANDALPLKSRFIEYDMHADFLDKLNASIAAFERHLDRQTTGQGENIDATVSLEAAFRRGEEMLERLDAAIRNKYHNDPVKIAAWESARRLERAPQRKNTDEPPQTPETPPQTQE
jgi:hypothetical protein